MEKHTREYARKLAKKYAEYTGSPFQEHDFTNGYMKAIEENNVVELKAVLDDCLIWATESGELPDKIFTRLVEAIQKSNT